MAVRVTAAHTAEARTEAGREAGEGGVAAAALAPGGFLGLPAPFGEEGNEARRCWQGQGGAAQPGLVEYRGLKLRARRPSWTELPAGSTCLPDPRRFPCGTPPPVESLCTFGGAPGSLEVPDWTPANADRPAL